MSDAGPLIGVALAGGILIGGGMFAYDAFVNGPKEKSLAQELAAASMTLDNQPQTEAQLVANLAGYKGESQIFENGQNVEDYTTASEIDLKFWNVPAASASNVETTERDLDRTFGEAVVRGAYNLATKKLNDARAIIDNRDPEVGPVLVYDHLEATEFDHIMSYLRAQGIESADDMPEGFLIVVDFFGPGKSLELDPTGERVKDTRFGDLVEQSPWNEALAKQGVTDRVREGFGRFLGGPDNE